MKICDVLECAFAKWYPNFQKVTFKSKILPLPEEVLQYLLADGLVLPEGSSCIRHDSCENNSDSENEVDWKEAANATPALQEPSFPDFNEKVKKAIAALGGAVFVKLDWSSPKDASWIGLNNSLKCISPGDIYLLLKSSDFTMHDLTQPFKHCEDAEAAGPQNLEYHLVLRRWMDVNPSTEFRCFVSNRRLIGISQRDDVNCYPHIDSEASDIIQDINSFYKEMIRQYFPLQNYTFDVIRLVKDVVKLIDFNPFGETTDPLMFTWEELHKIASGDISESSNITFRHVTTNLGVQPSPYRCYQFPSDVLDVCTGSDPAKLMDFLKMKIQSGEKEGSDSEDDDHAVV